MKQVDHLLSRTVHLIVSKLGKVAVIGLGYIGLPTAAILASRGQRVHGVDINEDSIKAIRSGMVPFVEPSLESLVREVVEDGTLTVGLVPEPADAFILAVPTPMRNDKTADLSYVEGAMRSIAPLLVGGELVVLESTSPVGSTSRLPGLLESLRPDLPAGSIDFAYCPERVLPGKVLDEIVSNDRIVGGCSDRAAERAKDLYSLFCDGEILLTNASTAEMAKLVENAYRDVNIAFANELSMICDNLNVDVWELIKLANHHPRVNILNPGPGVGGHCIAVDPWFIVEAAPEQSRLIRSARTVNDMKPDWVVSKVLDAHSKHDSNERIALLGLAFKADIDDLRESPAVQIAKSLIEYLPNVNFLIVEPHVTSLPPALTGNSKIQLVDLGKALDESSTVVVLVDHREFKEVPRAELAGKTVVDTRGIWQ